MSSASEPLIPRPGIAGLTVDVAVDRVAREVTQSQTLAREPQVGVIGGRDARTGVATTVTSPLSQRRGARSVLVVTTVHNPRDSRIWFRQIDALLTAGWDVTYAAPFSDCGLDPSETISPTPDGGSVTHVDLPRAWSRHRVRADLKARAVLKEYGPHHDVVLLHDPELLVAAFALGLHNVVWDVHEDAAAAMQVKAWMPKMLRTPTSLAWRMAERLVERSHHLMLAEYTYQRRFARPHPVMPNAVVVPPVVEPPGSDRVVYLGTVTRARGLDTLLEIGRELRRRTDGQVRLEVIGDAPEAEIAEQLRSAEQAGDLSWLGFMPSTAALRRIQGALAGLCLLQDRPNFRGSMPTKIVEYCAYGLPVVATPLPLAKELIDEADAGVIVDWDDAPAAVDAILGWRADPERVRTMAANGRSLVARRYDWRDWSQVFVTQMERFAAANR